MSFNIVKERKIKDTPAVVVMSIPEGSDITISSKVGGGYVPMQVFTVSQQIEISGNGSEIQITPSGSAEYELF